MKRILFTAPGTAELQFVPPFSDRLGPREIRGRTVVSLISPGTEVSLLRGTHFPHPPGYASVFSADEIGGEVTDIAPGSLLFGSGPHQEFQQADRALVVPLPAGLPPETAVFARLAGVSMTTLNTTSVRAPARVLVTGLGPVGSLAAQIFSRCGYEVTAVDPDEFRRNLALAAGLRDIRAKIDTSLADRVSLHVECSGNELAVRDGCGCVRKRGEVVLVGRPWRRQSELFAQELLDTIFLRYIVLRSGWEWETPMQTTDFFQNSFMANYSAALDWLARGALSVAGLTAGFAPTRAGEVYRGLLDRSLVVPAPHFDWRLPD